MHWRGLDNIFEKFRQYVGGVLTIYWRDSGINIGGIKAIHWRGLDNILEGFRHIYWRD